MSGRVIPQNLLVGQSPPADDTLVSLMCNPGHKPQSPNSAMRHILLILLFIAVSTALLALPPLNKGTKPPLKTTKKKAAPQPQGEKFRLVHADKLFLSKVVEENIMELNGNVHFFYGRTEFFSDRAFIFDTQRIARLDGNVTVKNDTLTASADSISFYRNSNKLNMGGSVQITEHKKDGTFNQFNSKYGIYDKQNDTVTTWGNVKTYSIKDKVRASCGYAFWDRRNGYGYLIEKPQLWSEGKDTLYVRSEKMEFFDADRKVVATFDVLASSKDYKTTSDFLLYFLKEDKAVFVGAPRFTSDFSDATATEFYLYFKDRSLTRAELKDSCLVYFAEAKTKPKTNWVKAQFISMNIADGNLSDFAAEKKVTYYYQQDKQEGIEKTATQEKQEKKDYFANDATGEFLTATFKEDGKLDRMKMKTSIKGIYRFENTPVK